MIQSKQSTHPFFTFIDHDDDLPSKRIRNINARKAIRSHVMRHVRLRERLAGHKRISRREPNESQLSRISNPTACAGNDLAIDSPVAQFEQSLRLVKPRPPHPVEYVLAADLNLQNARSLDPFDTLPGVSGLSSLMNALLHYCRLMFLSTVHEEKKSPTFPSRLATLAVLLSVSCATFVRGLSRFMWTTTMMKCAYKLLCSIRCVGVHPNDLSYRNDFFP